MSNRRYLRVPFRPEIYFGIFMRSFELTLKDGDAKVGVKSFFFIHGLTSDHGKD